jgi:hypothetical protein
MRPNSPIFSRASTTANRSRRCSYSLSRSAAVGAIIARSPTAAGPRQRAEPNPDQQTAGCGRGRAGSKTPSIVLAPVARVRSGRLNKACHPAGNPNISRGSSFPRGLNVPKLSRPIFSTGSSLSWAERDTTNPPETYRLASSNLAAVFITSPWKTMSRLVSRSRQPPRRQSAGCRAPGARVRTRVRSCRRPWQGPLELPGNSAERDHRRGRYPSGRTITTHPLLRSMPLMSKMSLRFFKSGQNIFS